MGKGYSVDVELTRTIGVGSKYIITSSYGYAGILDGVVLVEAICTPLEDEEVSKAADSFIEAELGISIEDYHKGNLGDMVDYLSILEEVNEWNTNLWVTYSYPDIPGEGLEYLPIALFAERIVTR